MGTNPLNLGLRFLLELAALTSVGIWGWKYGDDEWLKYVLSIGLPIILATIWGIFAVPNDPSRSGNAPIVTPGIIRLLLELGVFSFGAWAIYDIGLHELSLTFSIIVLLHYLISYDRILWLLAR